MAQAVDEKEGSVTIMTADDFGKDDDTVSKAVNSVMSTLDVSQLPLFVFDIHNVMEYTDDETDKQMIDQDVLKYIEALVKKGFNFLFLSYDGHKDRMAKNAKFLNDNSDILSKAPKLFIMKREKGLILQIIDKYITSNYEMDNKDANIVFIDDNVTNLENAQKYFDIPKELIVFNYYKHRGKQDASKDFENSDNFDDINKIFKI